MGEFFLTEGKLYTFHMSAAVSHLDDDNGEVIGTFVEVEKVGNQILLIVDREETGKRIALNAFYTCLFELVDDEDETEETDADGVRIFNAEGVPWACDVCGKPGYKANGPEGYCEEHWPGRGE